MVQMRLAAPYPVEVLGVVRQPDEVFEVPEDVAADLCRPGRGFEAVEQSPGGE